MIDVFAGVSILSEVGGWFEATGSTRGLYGSVSPVVFVGMPFLKHCQKPFSKAI